MIIRNTEMKDLPEVMAIYEFAREQMRLSGNPDQWKNSHPSEELILEDIKNKTGFVLEKDGKICGVFAFIIGEDPTYNYIEGKWKNGEPYGTIHRIASARTHRGIFSECLKFCESKISNIRIDTHEDNKIMQRVIEKNGFEKCGIIFVADGSPRIAYQKVKT